MTATDERDAVGVVLGTLRDLGPMRVRELAHDSGLSESTVRRVLTELEDADLADSAAPYGDNKRNGRGRIWEAV
jgi:predicted ArsR family transcriptional regulator